MLYLTCLVNDVKNGNKDGIIDASEINWGYVARYVEEVLKNTKKKGNVFRITCYTYHNDYVKHIVKVRSNAPSMLALIEREVQTIVPNVQYDDLAQMLLIAGGNFSNDVTEVAPGVYDAKYCNGTYFGSGSVSYSFQTNGTEEKVGEEDNGFCVVEYYKITLEPGQWLFRTYSSYPGGSNGMKSLVCVQEVQKAA